MITKNRKEKNTCFTRQIRNSETNKFLFLSCTNSSLPVNPDTLILQSIATAFKLKYIPITVRKINTAYLFIFITSRFSKSFTLICLKFSITFNDKISFSDFVIFALSIYSCKDKLSYSQILRYIS